MTTKSPPINYYDILGVAPSATTEQIQVAYRARISQYHPDRNRSTHANAIAALINEAWDALGDPKRRRLYDAQMGFGARSKPEPQESREQNNSRNPSNTAPPVPPPSPPRAGASPLPEPSASAVGFAHMSLGWKLYILAWAWIGIIVGVSNESAMSAVIVWAVGASVGWLLAPVIHWKGWRRIVMVTFAAAGILIVFALLVNNWDTVIPRVSPVIVILLVQLLRRTRLGQTRIRWSDRTGGTQPRRDDSAETCPNCGTPKAWVRRLSDGIVACWKCGRQRSPADVRTEPAARPVTRKMAPWGWVGVGMVALSFVAIAAFYVLRTRDLPKPPISQSLSEFHAPRPEDTSPPADRTVSSVSSITNKPLSALTSADSSLADGAQVPSQTTLHTRSRDDFPSQIPVVPAAARKDAYDFMSAVVEGMSEYIDAEEAIQPQSNMSATESPAYLVDTLAALRTAHAKWHLAQTFLTRFKSSQDTVVAETARYLAASYGEMSALYGRKVALFETAIRNPNINFADAAIESSKLQSQTRQVFEAIGLATAGASNAMVDTSRKDANGHVTFLKITRPERTEIAKRLKTLAGPFPDDTLEDDSRSTIRVPALILWRWFISAGWHGSDEK